MNPEPESAGAFKAALDRIMAEDAEVLEALADGADIRVEPGSLKTTTVDGQVKFVLDPDHWRPPAQFWPPTDDAYLAYRAANRPFRRAFSGGEFRRRILHAVGVSTATRKDAS